MPKPFLKRNPRRNEPALPEEKEFIPNCCTNVTIFPPTLLELMHKLLVVDPAPQSEEILESMLDAVEKVNTDRIDGNIMKNEMNSAINEPPAALVHGKERKSTPT